MSAGRHDQRFAAVRQVLPDLLGHERHERVEQPQRAFQRVGERRRTAPSPSSSPQAHLGDLEVPVAILRPEEVVDLPPRLAELIVLHQPRDLGVEACSPAENPAVGERHCGLRAARRAAVGIARPSRPSCSPMDEARRVPDLVGEVAVRLDARWRSASCRCRARRRDQREAQGVGAVLVRDLERVEHVALVLLILLALLVAHQCRAGRRCGTALADEARCPT